MNVFSNIFNRNDSSSEFLDMLPEAVMVISASGMIFQANQRAKSFLGIENSDIKSLNIGDLLESAIPVIEAALSTGKVQVAKSLLDGKRLVYLELNAKMNTLADESKIVVSLRDVTETYLQTAEIFSELEKYKFANADKNSFLVNLSNELQSPLHSAVGFSRALLENLGGALNDKQQKYISIINKNTTELLSVLEKITTLSKFEAESITIDYKNFDLIEFVNTNLNIFKKNDALKNINFSLEYDGLRTRNCYIDETLLTTLFNNAVDAMIRNVSSGNLSVTVSNPSEAMINEFELNLTENYDEKSFVMLSFLTDNFSVPENEFNFIMNPYKQAQRENKKYLETALAFAIVKCIVEFLDGIVYIEPRGIQGAVVDIIIRLDKPEMMNE